MQSWIKMFPAVIVVVAIAFVFPVVVSAQSPHYDLLLKGGHVIDPANHIDDARDVAVSQGKIAAVEKNIPLNWRARLWTYPSSMSRLDSSTFITTWAMAAHH